MSEREGGNGTPATVEELDEQLSGHIATNIMQVIGSTWRDSKHTDYSVIWHAHKIAVQSLIKNQFAGFWKDARDATAELSTLRAENERLQSESAAFEKLASDYQDVIARLDAKIDRLRERCEAAEKAVAFFFECQIAIQLPGGNADETFGFETLRDGRFAVTKWVDARQFFHIRDTPMEAFQDAITDNWLPDSNNKGGE